MKKTFQILAIFIVIIASLMSSQKLAVNAGGFLDLKNQEGFKNEEISKTFGEEGKPLDIRFFIANLIKITLGLLGIIFLVLTVIAGYKYMMAGGNQDQASEAMEQIKHAVIGLIIIMSSYAVTTFVIGILQKGNDDFWIF